MEASSRSAATPATGLGLLRGRLGGVPLGVCAFGGGLGEVTVAARGAFPVDRPVGAGLDPLGPAGGGVMFGFGAGGGGRAAGGLGFLPGGGQVGAELLGEGGLVSGGLLGRVKGATWRIGCSACNAVALVGT